jgi:hypothetical protein
VVLAFSIIELPAAWPVQWLVLLIGSVAVTFAAYEGIRRVGWLRILFGMKPRRPPSPGRPTASPETRDMVGTARR